MPLFDPDQKTFRVMVIVLVVVIVILIMVLVLKDTPIAAAITGLIGSIGAQISGENNQPIQPQEVDENGPWGYKTYKWSYLGKQHTFGMEITNVTYKQYNVNNGDNPIDYIITSNDGGAIRTVGTQIKNIAKTNKYDSQETLDLALAFVRSLSYKADYETGHSYDYPRAPVVTLTEMQGDSEDLTILAASILEYLGYGTAVVCYPPMQNTVNLYPQATALGIIGTDNSEGPVYCVETTYPKQDVTFVPSVFFGTSVKGKTDAKAPSTENAEYGWFAGNGYKQNDTQVVDMGMCAYVPYTGEFECENIHNIWHDYSGNISYTVKDASWVLPIKVVWVVDTNTKSVPVEVYNSQTPLILSGDGLWKGTVPGADSDRRLPGIEYLLDVPVPGYRDTTDWTEWNKQAHEFFKKDDWYKSELSWSMNDKWMIYENFLNIKNITGTALYTPWNTADCTAQSYWRLAYTAKGSGKGVKGMTPYSSAQIVVYKIVDGNPVLLDVTGWQGTSGADEYGKSRIYEPGNYAIGVFVRNADIKVNVEYFGTPTVTKYRGGI